MPLLAIGNIAGYLLDNPTLKIDSPAAPSSPLSALSAVRCVVVVDDSGIQAGSLTTAGATDRSGRR